MNRHNGARREFLIIGKPLLEAAEALDEAATGTVVCGATGWPYIEDEFEGEQTKSGNMKILGNLPNKIRACPPRIQETKPVYNAWTIMKL